MLYIFVAILLVLWALGMLTGTTMGGFIYLLPAAAVLMVLAGFFISRLDADVMEE
jgi:hypothetical protein